MISKILLVIVMAVGGMLIGSLVFGFVGIFIGASMDDPYSDYHLINYGYFGIIIGAVLGMISGIIFSYKIVRRNF